MHYSEEEKLDIYEIYIANGKNARASLREYVQRFPESRHPSHRIFKYTEQVFRNTKTLINKKRQKMRAVTTAETQLQVLLYFEEDPKRSIRNCCRQMNISYGTVSRILKMHKYKPYKQLPVQKLLPRDREARLVFCREMIRRNTEYPNFFDKILWTDEASFTTSGMFNRKNTHHWSSQNNHVIKEIQRQGRQSVNVWCGILGNRVLGPIFYRGSLTAERYLGFLENEIEDILEELPLNELRGIIWQQDGAPCHCTRAVTDFLTNKYNQWIGSHGTIHWAPRSPDLTPPDTFLWSYLKDKVYQENDLTIERIKDIIRENVADLNNNDIMANVRNNLIERYNICIQQNGGHIEHLI